MSSSSHQVAKVLELQLQLNEYSGLISFRIDRFHFTLLLFGEFQFSSVQSFSCVRLFATPWTTACQASLSISNTWSLLKQMCIESVMPSIISSSVISFSSCLQSFPAWGSFRMSQLFASGAQSIEISASVLLMNTQDWSPLGWTGWISFQSKRLSRVFSDTTVQKHQFFVAQLFL